MFQQKEITIKQIEIMRYLHYILDQEENQIESVYSANNTPKFSLECTVKIKNATYKIWDKETNEIITVK